MTYFWCLQDINAALHVENSVFPRGPKKNGNKRKKGAVSGTSSCLNKHLSPPRIGTEMRDEDAFLDSDDEGAAILGRPSDFNTTNGNGTALTSRSGLSDVSKLTQDTIIQDGVHVTSL